jgi:ketosteroid isomerase-like protein
MTDHDKETGMRVGIRNKLVTGMALAGLFAVVACQPAAEQAATPDYAAEYGPAVDAIFVAWNTKNYSTLDGALAANFTRVAPDQNAEGLEGAKAFMAQAHAAYPDFAITSNERAYAPGVAFVEWTATGTDSGEGGSGKPIEVSGATMYRFADGMITHEIVYWDTATLMRQVGAEVVPHAK